MALLTERDRTVCAHPKPRVVVCYFRSCEVQKLLLRPCIVRMIVTERRQVAVRAVIQRPVHKNHLEA